MTELKQDRAFEVSSEGARKIIAAATRLFAECGVDGVSIARIATEAGVGKATVFHHFASKEALHNAVLWQINQRAMSLVEDRSWEEGDLESCMAGFVRDQLRRFEENEESEALLRLVRREVLDADPDRLNLISEVIVEPFNRLRAHLAARQTAGDLPATVNLDLLSWLLMEVGVSYHEGRSVLARLPGFKSLVEDPEQFSHSIARMLVHGCLAQAGAACQQQDKNNH